MAARRANRFSGRQLLSGSALANVGLWLGRGGARGRSPSPNEKLNIACVGLGNQGNANQQLVASQNIVALSPLLPSARLALLVGLRQRYAGEYGA